MSGVVPLPDGYFEALAAWSRSTGGIGGCGRSPRRSCGNGSAAAGPLLDAGCGTGGFLAWLASLGVSPLAGVDPSAEAVERARAQAPAADVQVAELAALPFPDASFAVVTCNDVLQHVDEHDVARSLSELRRVLRSDGALLVRTNGGRRARRERPDWRLYDRATLRRGARAVRLPVPAGRRTSMSSDRPRRPSAAGSRRRRPARRTGSPRRRGTGAER